MGTMTDKGGDPGELYRRGVELLNDARDFHDPGETVGQRHLRHADTLAEARACFAGVQAAALLAVAAERVGLGDAATEDRWLSALGLDVAERDGDAG